MTSNSPSYSLRNDAWIRQRALDDGMISPFVDGLVRTEEGGRRVISYGLSSFGYDLRCAPHFKVFKRGKHLIDPKNLDEAAFETIHADSCVIPPNGFILTHSVETLSIPDNVLGICVGKSTYARIGLIVNVTPLEPGWSGELVLELSNTTGSPAVVYANEGICQLLFYEGERPLTTYADRGGKYQGQRGITLPRL